MPPVQSIEGCLETAIGAHGLGSGALTRALASLDAEIDALKDDYRSGRLPLLAVPDRTDDIADAAEALGHLTEGARTLVFFGTGGSSLGGQALAQVGGWFIPGEQTEGQARRPRTRFYDNLDPRTLQGTLDGLDFERTRFIVISKSGSTPETLAQFLAALEAVVAAGLSARLPELFLALTEPEAEGRANPLREICATRGIPVLEHHPGIGGRFSVLTNVGLLAALARGLDGAALRRGARDVVDALLAAERAADFAPAIGAAATIGLVRERGVRAAVMMPYTDRLSRFSHWWVQLWSESLGKGGEGTTAVAALGPVDQHSQLQLYLDGPTGKMFTIVAPGHAGTGATVDAGLAEQLGLDYLAGRTVGDLMAAEQQATIDSLVSAGRPTRVLAVDKVDGATMGALMMHYLIEAVVAARLLAVNPFDQPAVEDSKVRAREYLRDAT